SGKNVLAAMIGFLFGTSGAQGVMAQDQGNDGPRSYVIEEVIVSAQRRDQNMQDVGIAITQFSREDMRELRVVRPEDLAAQTPGLDIKNGLGNFNPIFTIRGIGLNDYNVNNNPSVGAYLDEVYMPNGAYLAFSLYDMGRVEVLKGPQGTLFGRNTTAGAINFHTVKPTEEFEAFIKMDYGRWNTINLEGAIGGPLSETMRGRLAFAANSSDGSYTNNGTTVAGGLVGPSASTFDEQFGPEDSASLTPPNAVVERDSDFFEQENYAIRASLEWDPSDTVQVFVTGHYSNDSSDNLVRSMSADAVDRNGFSPTDDDPFSVDANLDPEVDIDGYGGALNVVWDLESLTLTSITGYETIDRMIPFDDSSPWRIVDQIFFDDAEFYSQELRLSSNDDGPLFWMVGGFYSHEDLTFQKDIFGLDFVVRTSILTLFDQDADSYAAFAHTEYDLSEQWKLTLGARYTYDDRSYEGGSFTEDPYGIDLAPIFFSAPQQSSGGFDEDYVDGKIALDWTPGEDMLFYGSVSLGHKGGGYDGSTITDPSSFDPFKAEEVVAYEIGVKSSLLDSTLQLNASAFFYDYTDMQAEAEREVPPGGVFESVRANVGEAEIYGIDADLWWRPAAGLDIKLGLAYLDTELTSWNSTDPEEIAKFVGNEIPDAPEFTANGMIRYEWPIADALVASVLFDANYTGSTFKDIDNSDYLEQPSYWLANARASVGSEGGDWNVALYVRNLADEEYIRQAFDNFGPAWVYETWGAPRTYGITAIKYF
ncbi:MAG: TonB-dependent receptor, partial [Gammaproteobacteria bacterium]|nr:TonB-dependent receptor [Gammaproteobacteria bacterium]